MFNNMQPETKHELFVWIQRACFAAVFCWNVVCALQFIFEPSGYAKSFMLEYAQVPGQVAVQGMGIMFLVWNATYPLFIFKPEKYRVLGGVIIAQQIIGLVGELIILSTIMSEYYALTYAIRRFAIFDGIGLLLEYGSFALAGFMLKPSYKED